MKGVHFRSKLTCSKRLSERLKQAISKLVYKWLRIWTSGQTLPVSNSRCRRETRLGRVPRLRSVSRPSREIVTGQVSTGNSFNLTRPLIRLSRRVFKDEFKE